MKLLLLLSCTCLAVAGELAAASKVVPHRYLQELATIAPVPLANVVGASYFRQAFPQSYNSPYWHDYITQKHAEGKTYEEAANLYQLMFVNGTAMVETFTEEHALALLMADPAYRAHVIGHFSIASSLVVAAAVRQGGGLCPDCGKLHPPKELVDHFIGLSNGGEAYGKQLVPLLMAIDGDQSLAELRERAAELSLHGFDIRYQQRPRLDVHSRINNHGHYLTRTTHVRHPPPSPYDLDALQQDGYDIDIMRKLLSASYITKILLHDDALSMEVVEGRARIGAIDFALATDLMLEAGILVPGFSTEFIEEALENNWLDIVGRETNGDQHISANPLLILVRRYGQRDTLAALAAELELKVDSAGFEVLLKDIENLVNNPQHQASLFQIVQLSRLGFSLEEIKMLSYDARDAIIVSNPEEKADFVAKLKETLGIAGFDAEDINTIVAETGALVFMLLNHGYDLEDINPHQASSYQHLVWQ